MISLWLATFLLNAVWQISAITLITIACARLLKRLPARYTHCVWVAALIASALIPLMTVIVQRHIIPPIQEHDLKAAENTAKTESAATPISLRSLSRPVSVSPTLTRISLWAFSLLLAYRVTKLAAGIYQTQRIRRSAYPREISSELQAAIERCSRALSNQAVPVLCCDLVPAPATIGFERPVVLLPSIYFTGEFSQADLASSLSHEFAHIQRRDFLLNLIYETISLAVCFHPLTAFIKSRISCTRELACDDSAARILPSEACYATALLRIAQSVTSHTPDSNYALGLFDTNALEERIVNILNPSDANGTWRRSLKLMGACGVGALALGISAFSLKLAAENTPDLQKFAGTWECRYKGHVFFTLKMGLKNGTLSGSSNHSTSVSFVDGEIIPITDETTEDRMFETHATGQELFIRIADGPNDADPISLTFRLTGKDEAEAKLTVDKQPNGPQQTKPWHFTRVH